MMHIEAHPDPLQAKKGAIIKTEIACGCNSTDCQECLDRAILAQAIALKVQPPPAVRQRSGEEVAVSVEGKIDTLAQLILDMKDSFARTEERLDALEGKGRAYADPAHHEGQ